MTLFKCFYYWLWAGFRSWSSVSVVNFGQVNTYWDVYINDDTNEMKYWVSLLKTYEAKKEKQFGIQNCPNFARQTKLGCVFKKLGNFTIFEIFAGNNFFSVNFTLLMPFQDQKCNLHNFESRRYWTVPAILSNLGDMWKFCLSNHIQVIFRQPMLETKTNKFVKSLGPVAVILLDFYLSFWKKSPKPGNNRMVYAINWIQINNYYLCMTWSILLVRGFDISKIVHSFPKTINF